MLFSESRTAEPENGACLGQWRFVLESLGDGESFEAAAEESAPSPESLELLAVVRGLEALDQPSRVTLVTTSRYVARGLRHGLQHWRESDFQWERFGRLVPVKHGELWRRIDQALRFHRVECRLWSYGGAAQTAPAECREPLAACEPAETPAAACRRVAGLAAACVRRWISGENQRPGVAAAA